VVARRDGIGRLEGLYNRVTAQTPDDARTLNVKSVLALDNDRPSEAAELIGRALVIEPSEFTYLFHLAKICARAGWWNHCVDALRRAIYVDPRNPESWYGLGQAFEELDSLGDAEICWQQCLALDSRHEGAGDALRRTAGR
jgi:predicted Zn-dependent protease